MTEIREEFFEVTDAFILTVRHTPIVQRGQTYRFFFAHENLKDGPKDLTVTAVLKIYDMTSPNNVLKDTPGSINQTDLGTGEYKTDFLIPTTYGSGDYLAEWSGTYIDTDTVTHTILIRKPFIVQTGNI